ncbi:hypothetical protein CJ010_14515 [Azoarcus sp. DD4]|uniref:alpha/beta hydrolase n=1 Tax=Azoarcus sp. DD4 TaxID=2027405 RepID=UPI00112B99CF|nr:alpha/beta hydrolase [Azoarcus sp. DD4]QDF97661.1 hypothetical protein CJ010_14515 [Azoarcus sp. DD4]
MFFVTNREIVAGETGMGQLGTTPNSKGPNELRLVEAVKSGRSWSVSVLPDVVTPDMRSSAGIAPSDQPVYASAYVARVLLERIRKEKKNLLFFVHGFNNDVKAVLERANSLQQLYGVEVLAFSWPANGGGLSGVASYKSDQRDARASVGAFDRCLGRIGELLAELTVQEGIRLQEEARLRHPDDAEKREAFFARLQEKHCPFTVNMMLHSMGNYLYKHTLLSTASYADRLVFDNIVLLAADTNNLDHAQWVDRIPCRKSVYITINENDGALRASRMKTGEQQQARLGHYRHRLDARQALYVDFTGAPQVGSSHAYFEDDTVRLKTAVARQFFQRAFNGERAEDGLPFDPATHMYRIPGA